MGLRLEKYVTAIGFIPVLIDSRAITSVTRHVRAGNGCYIRVGDQDVWVKGEFDEVVKLIEQDLKDHDGYKISNIVKLGD